MCAKWPGFSFNVEINQFARSCMPNACLAVIVKKDVSLFSFFGTNEKNIYIYSLLNIPKYKCKKNPHLSVVLICCT